LHAEAAQRARRVAVSAERERVVRDVHDTVARALGAILLPLDAAEADVPDAAASARHLAQARQAAGAALSETRRTVLGLGPALLELHSLDEAIALELAWARSTTGIRSDLVITGEPPSGDVRGGPDGDTDGDTGADTGADTGVGLDPEIGQQALRLVQEALTNVVTHAKAQLVRVGVMYDADGVSVLVEDDGVGFDPVELAERRRPTRGLHGIVARARRLGGDLQIESTPGWGTRVRARLPYRLADRSSAGPDRPLWRVLVVDPRPVVRAGLVRLLARAEPEIQVVGEIAVAGEVVDAVRVLEPDVVLLDLHMPELDGARLTSYVRAASPGVSVLVMTDDHTDELLRDAVHAGARGCIGADLDGPALARAVLAAARGDLLLTDTVLSGFVRGRRLPDGVALTAREQEVRGLVERGLRDKQIASRLGISVKTVEKHVGAVLRKTGSANRTTLAHRAAVR
jgi:DNA-binding NarL/FixJ family response regulator